MDPSLDASTPSSSSPAPPLTVLPSLRRPPDPGARKRAGRTMSRMVPSQPSPQPRDVTDISGHTTRPDRLTVWKANRVRNRAVAKTGIVLAAAGLAGMVTLLAQSSRSGGGRSPATAPGYSETQPSMVGDRHPMWISTRYRRRRERQHCVTCPRRLHL